MSADAFNVIVNAMNQCRDPHDRVCHAVSVSIHWATLLGMFIDRVAYRPLRQASRISILITAIGVSFFLENLFNVLFGGSSRFFSAPTISTTH